VSSWSCFASACSWLAQPSPGRSFRSAIGARNSKDRFEASACGRRSCSSLSTSWRWLPWCPLTTVTLAAGFAFGFAGLPLALASATIASGCAFLISKYVVAGRLKRLIEDLPRSRAIYRAVGNGGWRIVLLLRLSPIMPFSVLNYALGATDLGFWHYISATFAGIIPAVTLYVYIGALGEAAVASAPFGTARLLLLLLGLAATLVAAIYLARKARAQLERAAFAAPLPGRNPLKR
jgi:uncharacterized membrane protein YdjX (TVP38/TMEM64 family)